MLDYNANAYVFSYLKKVNPKKFLEREELKTKCNIPCVQKVFNGK